MMSQPSLYLYNTTALLIKSWSQTWHQTVSTLFSYRLAAPPKGDPPSPSPTKPDVIEWGAVPRLKYMNWINFPDNRECFVLSGCMPTLTRLYLGRPYHRDVDEDSYLLLLMCRCCILTHCCFDCCWSSFTDRRLTEGLTGEIHSLASFVAKSQWKESGRPWSLLTAVNVDELHSLFPMFYCSNQSN